MAAANTGKALQLAQAAQESVPMVVYDDVRSPLKASVGALAIIFESIEVRS